MVLAPAWGQGSTGSDGGVVVTPDGSTVIGAEGETTVVTGTSTGVHTLFKNNDTASTAQEVRVCIRSYDAAVPTSLFRFDTTSTTSILYLGRGDLGVSASITHGYLYAGSGVAAGSGSKRFAWTNNGVNVGINPANPTSGRAWQCTTTGQATAAYFDDADGTFVMPWSAVSATNAQVKLGSAQNLSIHSRTTESVLTLSSGDFRCKVITGQVHDFQVNGVSTAQINGNGLALGLTGSSANPNCTIGGGGEIAFYNNGADSAIEGKTDDLYVLQVTAGKYLYLRGPTSGGIRLQNNVTTIAQVLPGGLQIETGNVITMIGQAGDYGSPSAGMIEYNSTSNKHRGYDGTIWNDLY